ncbi:MAG: hypothetical protein ABIA37_04900 [Candidatus Woesearchaeota archaeon]
MKKKTAGRGFWEKIEHYNAKLIPPAIIALLILITVELFFHSEDHTVQLIIHITDYLVLAVFIIDLIFLAIHARSVKFFFKSYWLDILAVLPLTPFFLLVDYLFRAVIFAGTITLGQSIMHETLELRKGFASLSRSQKFLKYIRMGLRSLRATTKSRLFTKMSHHRHKEFKPKKEDLRKKGGKK